MRTHPSVEHDAQISVAEIDEYHEVLHVGMAESNPLGGLDHGIDPFGIPVGYRVVVPCEYPLFPLHDASSGSGRLLEVQFEHLFVP